MMMVQDSSLHKSRSAVFEHLMRKVSDWQTPESSKAMLSSLCKEMQVKDVQGIIDAAKDTDGKDASQ